MKLSGGHNGLQNECKYVHTFLFVSVYTNMQAC